MTPLPASAPFVPGGLADVGSLTLRLCEESQTDLAASETPLPRQARETAAENLAGAVSLPEPLARSRPLFDVLRDRKAVRSYQGAPISQQALATMLKTAADGDAADWPEEQDISKLQLIVVGWRLEGIAPAIYEYVPGRHLLSLIGPAPDQQTEGADLVLQTEFARASAIVLITGALGTALARHGSWGHRNLLLRAGAAGQRLWLASLGAGLQGSVFAGFLPAAARRHAGVDGYHRAGLLAWATG